MRPRWVSKPRLTVRLIVGRNVTLTSIQNPSILTLTRDNVFTDSRLKIYRALFSKD
jgi:hypothetical protein